MLSLLFKKLVLFSCTFFFVSQAYAVSTEYLTKLVEKAADGDLESQKELKDLNKPANDDKLKEVFDYFLKMAEKDKDPAVQNIIGYMHYHGVGVIDDEDQALKWFLRSAKQKNSMAQYHPLVNLELVGFILTRKIIKKP